MSTISTRLAPRLVCLSLCVSLAHVGGSAINSERCPRQYAPRGDAGTGVRAQYSLTASDTLGPSAPATRRELRELRRMDDVERRLARREARRRPGQPPPKVFETAGGFDVASFALGIAGLGLYGAAIVVWGPLIFLSAVAFLLAAVFGTIARRRIRYGARGNRGLALVGGIIGWIFSVAFLAGLVALLFIG